MKRRKTLILIAIASFLLILITLFFAPTKNQQQSGSTFNRQPDGYAAWYEYMKGKNINIQRSEKPFQKLIKNNDSPLTLLQIKPNSQQYFYSSINADWVKKGNNLIIVGVKEFPTKAEFSTIHNSDFGMIKIETSRRRKYQYPTKSILKDEFGDIVWKNQIGKGEITKIVTPYFAANAYQDYTANYEFLAELVTKYNQPIWVDEYLHGYKDEEVIKEEIGQDLFSYLAKKPLMIVFIQGIILLLVYLWGFNNRFGKPLKLFSPKINYSEAYINALSSVLHKSESSDFLVEMIGKEEQLQLQKQLGLGNTLLDNQTLIEVWQNQGGNKKQLQSILSFPTKKTRFQEKDLLIWLNQWQTIRNFNLKNK